MAAGELAIVIEGRREDWPGGPRVLMARPPSREPNGRTCWFGAELDPDGDQISVRCSVRRSANLRREPRVEARQFSVRTSAISVRTWAISVGYAELRIAARLGITAAVPRRGARARTGPAGPGP